jgi:hypothetical protein
MVFKDRWFRHVFTSNHVLICSDRVRKSMRVQYGTIDDTVPIWCSRLMSQPSPHSENPAVAGAMAIHIPSWGALSAWSVFGVEWCVALLIRWRRDDNGPETWTGWWLGTWMEKMTFPSSCEWNNHPNWLIFSEGKPPSSGNSRHESAMNWDMKKISCQKVVDVRTLRCFSQTDCAVRILRDSDLLHAWDCGFIERLDPQAKRDALRIFVCKHGIAKSPRAWIIHSGNFSDFALETHPTG